MRSTNSVPAAVLSLGLVSCSGPSAPIETASRTNIALSEQDAEKIAERARFNAWFAVKFNDRFILSPMRGAHAGIASLLIGQHEKRWRRVNAIDYLFENTPNPEGDCRKAIERYIVMPGQATAYKFGMIKTLDLREDARSRLGDAFDIRDFHDVVLKDGPVPLQILEENVEA